MKVDTRGSGTLVVQSCVTASGTNLRKVEHSVQENQFATSAIVGSGMLSNLANKSLSADPHHQVSDLQPVLLDTKVQEL